MALKTEKILSSRKGKSMTTEKRKKFVKFSNLRLQNAINHISLIGKLANKRAYDYSEKDVNIIGEVLLNEVETTLRKLRKLEKIESEDYIK